MGHIVSEGMKSLGHVVYRTECLRGMLYPGADCHCSRLSSGQIVSGVLSPWHIVSGSYFLRGGFSAGRMVCESDCLWGELSNQPLILQRQDLCQKPSKLIPFKLQVLDVETEWTVTYREVLEYLTETYVKMITNLK